MPDLDPTQQAAAFHGLATNQSLTPHERLAVALQALDLYEAECERLGAQIARHTETLDLIETALDTATDDTLRPAVRSMIRRARLAASEATP